MIFKFQLKLKLKNEPLYVVTEFHGTIACVGSKNFGKALFYQARAYNIKTNNYWRMQDYENLLNAEATSQQN